MSPDRSIKIGQKLMKYVEIGKRSYLTFSCAFSLQSFILFLTVRVISHGPISLKIVLVLVVVVEDILLKFQYIMNNSTILLIHKILE